MDANGERQSVLPEGRVALLFTDIAGSTALLHDLGETYGDLLDEHDRVLRGIWAQFGGVEVDNEGDAFFVAFANHENAVNAAAEVVHRCRERSWPGGADLRIRVALHSGEPRIRQQRYWGVDVHYAARLCAAGNGGQVILSATMRSAVPDIEVQSLGEHRVKDFPTARELFHLVVDGSRPEDFPAPRTLSQARSNLPTVPGPIVGREDVVADLAARLSGQNDRVLTVTGPGGIGKTRLALAVGERLAGDDTDVLLVELAGALDLNGALLTLADACGIPPGAVDPRQAVIQSLRDQELVLILDNAEHLPEMAAVVADLHAQAHGVRMLVTSQVPLHVRGEQVVPLAPLPPPATGEQDAAEIAGSPAVELFVRLVRAQHPEFRLTQENAADVAELCRAVEGMPLALELAAARAPVVGVARLVARLAEDDDALGRGPRDLPDRQRGLAAALGWTVSLLTEQERVVFAGLGAFAGAWTLEWSELLFEGEIEPADTWEALIRLTEVSLVTQRGDGRFTMPERVRRHAREVLAVSGEESLWRRRHAELLIEHVAGTTADILFDWDRLVADVEDAVDEVLHATSWAAAEDPETLRNLLAAFTIPLSECVGLGALRAMASMVDDGGRECHSRADALFRLAQARLLSLATDTLPQRVDLVASILDYLEVHGTVEDVVLAAEFHFDGLRFSGEYDEAARMSERLLTRPDVAADPRLAALVTRWLVALELEQGHGAEAERLLEALDASGSVLPEQDAHNAHLRGDAAMESGRSADAIGWYARALRSSPVSGYLWSVWTVQSMACGWAALGADATAVELLEAVAATYRERMGSEMILHPATRARTRAPYERLSAEELAEAKARGQALDYPAWRDRALELADELAASG